MAEQEPHRLPKGIPISSEPDQSRDKPLSSPQPLLTGSSTLSLFDQEANASIEIEINIDAEKRLVRKLDFTVFPILFIVFMMSFLDRINISNARIQGLTEELDLTGNRFNMALFVGRSFYTTCYFVCHEPHSN